MGRIEKKEGQRELVPKCEQQWETFFFEDQQKRAYEAVLLSGMPADLQIEQADPKFRQVG